MIIYDVDMKKLLKNDQEEYRKVDEMRQYCIDHKLVDERILENLSHMTGVKSINVYTEYVFLKGQMIKEVDRNAQKKVPV